MQVDSVSANSVTGIVENYMPDYGTSNTQQVQCSEGQAPCVGRFWLDPKNPTASIKGENGVMYKVAGRQPIQLLGKTWDATLLQYKDAQQGPDFHLYYDTETGLILSYSIKYPNQEVSLSLNSIDIGAGDNIDFGTANGYNGYKGYNGFNGFTEANTDKGYQNANADDLDVLVDPVDRY
ncbi:MAG: hypothetical protein ACE14P_01990 [Methanotrichaceae archaeon]